MKQSTDEVLRLPSVIQKIGLSRSTIYASILEGNFPKPIRLGPRAVGWLKSEIDVWLNERIIASRG